MGDRPETRVLVMDADERFARALVERLRLHGIDAAVATSTREVRERAAAYGVVVVGARVIEGDGLDVGPLLAPGGRVAILLSEQTTSGDIEAATRAGFDDCACRSASLDELALRVRTAGALAELRERVARYDRIVRPRDADRLLGASEPMMNVFDRIQSLADAGAVLVTGETGVGKSAVARALHAARPKPEAPFVEVACARLPTATAVQELFGDARRPGLVEAASGGTVVLDEIGSLAATARETLARAAPHNTTIVGICTRDPGDVVAARLGPELVAMFGDREIAVPPLRDRGDDVLILANHFAVEAARRLGRATPTLTCDAIAFLRVHPYPANVRELRAIIEQAVVRAKGATIDTALFARRVSRRAGRPPTPLTADEAQRIRSVMNDVGDSKAKAAARLGLSRFALRRKLQMLAALDSAARGR